MNQTPISNQREPIFASNRRYPRSAARLAPLLARTLLAAQAELTGHPDHERILSGRGYGGTLLRPASPEPVNGAVELAPTELRLVAPSTVACCARPGQLARRKAIEQAQPQEVSICAIARLLGVLHITVSNLVHANGVPGRTTSAAPSLQERPDTDKVAARQRSLDQFLSDELSRFRPDAAQKKVDTLLRWRISGVVTSG